MQPILTRFVLAVLLAVGLLASAANAQILYGGIVGSVTDPQGAVLPGVTVSITNTGTGLKLDTVTDETGSYVFRNLQPGTYNLTFSGKGFKELQQSGLAVAAGDPRRTNVALQIGTAQETVTVTASAATLRTETTNLSTEINSVPR